MKNAHRELRKQNYEVIYRLTAKFDLYLKTNIKIQPQHFFISEEHNIVNLSSMATKCFLPKQNLKKNETIPQTWIILIQYFTKTKVLNVLKKSKLFISAAWC